MSCIASGEQVVPYNAHCCVTETLHFPGDTNLKHIERRFALYKGIGVDMLRLAAFPDLGGISEEYLKLLKASSFRLKIIVANMPSGPQYELTDQFGRPSKGAINYWNPDLRPRAEEMTAAIADSLRKAGLMDRVDFVIPAMGAAGEPVYPHPWTTGYEKPSFWCYGEHAQRDFRRVMYTRYGSINAADEAWGTHFETWDNVHVLKPGEQPGPYWHDVLNWYRDSKRDYVRWSIATVQKHFPGKTVVLYVPGARFTEKEWYEAIAQGGGSLWIMVMPDHDFIIDEAAKQGCWIQYTGFGPGSDAEYIGNYVKDHGYSHVGMWAENVGDPRAIQDPVKTCQMVVDHGYFGFDLTFSGFMLDDNELTPNALFPAMAKGFQIIEDAKTGDALRKVTVAPKDGTG